jgi:hypothetical protein
VQIAFCYEIMTEGCWREQGEAPKDAETSSEKTAFQKAIYGQRTCRALR